jgi:hypothetical protein
MTPRPLMGKLTLAMLLCSVSAQAQEAPRLHLDRLSVVAGVAGQVADGITSYRFLHNGSGCTESNRYTGPIPSAGQIVLSRAVTVGVTLAAQYALVRLGHGSVTKWSSRLLGYTSGAIGIQAAVHNVRSCGW